MLFNREPFSSCTGEPLRRLEKLAHRFFHPVASRRIYRDHPLVGVDVESLAEVGNPWLLFGAWADPDVLVVLLHLPAFF